MLQGSSMMLKFFDCEMGVGGTAFGYPAIRTPSELLAIMDHYNIDGALVYDRGAHESGVFDRFDFIVEFCRSSPRLHPAIPIVPPATAEQPPPDELIAFCLENGIRAVRACPSAHRFSFDSFSMGPLLAELQKHRMPVVHTSMHLQDHPWEHQPVWDNIRDAATAFPELPIVVLYTGMLQGRRLFPLLAQCPNVLADLTCVSFQYVEDVVERFGSNRLVFASHFPTEDPGLYTPGVIYAGIPPDAREAVARGNITRLLEGAQ